MPWPPHHLAITGETRDIQCEACSRTDSGDLIYWLGDPEFPEYPYTWACAACLSRMFNEGHIDWIQTYNLWGAPPNIIARIQLHVDGGQIRPRLTPSAPFRAVNPLDTAHPGQHPGQGNATRGRARPDPGPPV